MSVDEERFGWCNLCQPPHRVPLTYMATHLLVVHDTDLHAVVEKWPDGEWVVMDNTLEPADFEEPV